MYQNKADIKSGGLSNPKVVALLQQHLEEMANQSPVESIHALDLKALQHHHISFWTAWINKDLAGCAALKELNSNSAEIKSMRTSTSHQRNGIASQLLTHLIELAKKQNYTTLYLETGSQPTFAPATNLYKKFGFVLCKPYADYKEDPNSIFMLLNL